MKYILKNSPFLDCEIEITNIAAINEIDREINETLNTSIGTAFYIKIDKLIFKLILQEKDENCFKFKLTSNIYM